MTCPSCKRGALSRTRKPDALGRTLEKCDSCAYRRVVDAPEEVPPLSGSVVRSNGSNGANGHAPANAFAAPVAVVGQPCPCCHRPVKQLPICVKCKKNRRVLGKTKCEECSKPAWAKPRYCVKCGDQFTPTREEKLSGTAAYHCPKHRSARRKKASPVATA